MKTRYEQNAMIFKAFCDEKRLVILEMLQNGELCACKIQENLTISQSTLSHHMKILCDSRIVVGRKEGKWIYYSISQEGSKQAVELMKQLTKVNQTTFEEANCES